VEEGGSTRLRENAPGTRYSQIDGFLCWNQQAENLNFPGVILRIRDRDEISAMLRQGRGAESRGSLWPLSGLLDPEVKVANTRM
jgi:hypothetical protein